MFGAFSPLSCSGPPLRVPEDFGGTPTELIMGDGAPLGRALQEQPQIHRPARGWASKELVI